MDRSIEVTNSQNSKLSSVARADSKLRKSKQGDPRLLAVSTT